MRPTTLANAAGGTRPDLRLGSLGRRGECDMHAGDRHPTLTHRSSAPLYRSGTNVAGGENARNAGFEGAGRALAFLPGGRVGNSGAGLDEAFLVARDLGWQPTGARHGTDHGKDRWRL